MNDLIQFVLKVVAAIGIAVIAIATISPAQIAAAVPAGWDELFFSWKLDVDWSAKLPALQERVVNPITQGGDGYAFFALFVSMLFFKGVLVSMAGPTPNYAIQHILSTRNPKEAALENMMMAVVSLAPRFLLIAAIAVLAIVFFSPDLATLIAAKGKDAKFEEILPRVLNRDYIPVGFKGILIAALLASFMSTFVSTVNSGAAYVVNDIYKRYINPDAPAKRYVALGWATSSAVILLGIGFGFLTKDVHSITKWITSSLIPAFVIPNVLKWHWWRFNGYGFFAGMVAGTAAALALLPLKSLHEVYIVLIILGVSAGASVVACLVTAPEPIAVLASFYRNVRPWGFWGPVYAAIRAQDPTFEKNRDFARDLFNLAIGLVWQVAMVACPMYLVIQKYNQAIIAFGIFAATSLVLKFTWYDKLGPGEMYMTPDGKAPEAAERPPSV